MANNGIQYVALVQKFKKSVNDLKVADKDQIAKVVQSLTELNIQASSTKDYVTGLSAGSPDVVSIADQAMKCAGDLTGALDELTTKVEHVRSAGMTSDVQTVLKQAGASITQVNEQIHKSCPEGAKTEAEEVFKKLGAAYQKAEEAYSK